jgi:hypothetical protein
MVFAPLIQPRSKKALRLDVKISGLRASVVSRLLPRYCLILLAGFSADSPLTAEPGYWMRDFQAINPAR